LTPLFTRCYPKPLREPSVPPENMQDTLNALGGILLRAVPTFVLIVFLYFYAKLVFFKPMGRVLEQRYAETEGARKMAEKSLALAEQKTAEYEAAMRAARTEVYQQQEKLHKELQEREAAAVADAKQKADALVRQAREQLDQDVLAAREALTRDSEMLASQIADSVLRRSAA
jgi:F-type H+-transporting ATPase subunit b